MALADIISKIESDAAEEAATIVRAAEQRAGEIRVAAEAQAAEYRETTLAGVVHDARREASRVAVAAKLEARDAGLAAKRALVEEALEATADGLAKLPADRYAAFLASRIASAARGGEMLRFGSADEDVAGEVMAALERVAPGLAVAVASEPAPFERGVLLEGDRVRADLSLRAIVDERRDELELAVSEALFGKGE